MALFRSSFVFPTLLRYFARPSTTRVDELGSLTCRLGSRAVVKFDGPDTIKFLNGLLSNDVRPLAVAAVSEQTVSRSSDHPTPNASPLGSSPLYSAMLTPQGRFLYDFFLYRPVRPSENLDRREAGPGSNGLGDTLFADVDATVVSEVLDCFKKYRLRSKVEIENVTGEFSCWQRFGGNAAVHSSSVQEPDAAAVWGGRTDCAAVSSAQSNNIGWCWHKDPRLNCLGFRGIFPSETIPPLVESDKEMDEQHYLLWRLERGIAEGSDEIPKGYAIPFEYNLTGLNAISFDKGCYLGQEFVARTHHRGVIRKRLVPLKFTNDSGSEIEQKVAPGAEVVETKSSKKIGIVTTALGSTGMGVLRLDDAFKASLSIQDRPDLKVKVTRPEWWPAEWLVFREETAVA